MSDLTKDYLVGHELTIRQMVDFMDAHGTEDLADVGGAGYEERMAVLGYTPDVYDLSRDEMGEKGFEHDICLSPLPRKYATILCCNTLEHVIDPYGTANNLVASLKPGGWIFVTTVWKYPYHAYRDVPDTYRYTDQSLSILFRDLEEERCWYEDEFHPEGCVRVSYIGRKKSK